MPVVNVLYKRWNTDPQLQLREALPAIVAKRLNVGDAPPITAENVIIVFQKLSHLDVCKYDVVILVSAHNYPDRIRAQLSIAEAIAEDVSMVCTNRYCSVIINLTPLEWAARTSASR